MVGVSLATDLVNLSLGVLWSPRSVAEALSRNEIRQHALAAPDLELVRDWADALRGVYTAGDVDERCAKMNALLSKAARTVYLTTHDHLRPHLHFTPEGDGAVDRIKSVTAGGLALFLVEAEGHRLGVCALPTCSTAFVDTSRNGTRTYCTARCGNTAAVHRHRGGQASTRARTPLPR